MIHDLLEDRQGQLWAATRSGGFFRFVPRAEGAPTVAEVHNRQNGLPTDWVFQLFQARDGKFWLATNVGLIEFSPNVEPSDQRFHSYTPRNGLTYHEITALNEDMNGNLWLGTNVSGAMKLERHGFITWDSEDGIVAVNAIFGDHAGGVCFRAFGENPRDNAATVQANKAAYQQQLGRYDEKGFDWFMPAVLRKEGWIFEGITLQARNGEWWIGTGEGLYRFPPAENFTQLKSMRPLNVYTTKDGLAELQVFHLFEDSRGDVWISTIGPPNGLARWEHATGRIQDLTTAPNLPSAKDDLAGGLGEDALGNIWVGFGGGVARYHSGSFTFFSAKDGLPPGGIGQAFLDHANRLWLASSRGGLIRVDNSGAERPGFRNYTTAEGLSANGTGIITEDLQGRIYVGTGRGLDQLNPETGGIKHFTTADGLASGGINSAFRDRHGAIWFGTQKGMSRFEPSAETSATSPSILISALNVRGSSQRVSALGENEVLLPDFSASQNQMQIDFVGLSFAVGDVLRYQYKLEGANSDWSAPTGQRTVNFASLSPGHYRFLVRAINSDGLVSSRPAVVRFTILPPIWARWWFITLAVMMVMLAAYTLYRYRVRRLLELERVRTRIAADLHDDIGSNLSLIAGLSEVLNAQVRGTNGQVADRLSTIASVSRRSVDAMSDIVWAVNPKRDNAVDLSHRMRRFASDTLTARNIEFHLTTSSLDRHTRVNAETRRELFLIFKEAINNIARHSAGRRADAELRVARGTIVMLLRDDGCGFQTSDGAQGHGLESMRRRAEKIGGELKFNSSVGAGTSLELRVPLNYRGD
ncbi:MAG TPA: two-component regulator propeller domain-containing protein [Pyrinomonadaceae bacterium]|nr:two-component regulator propeller domain-containing protein [Pyrinomonadaceae bacterium]